jgi:hypothetical protein
VHPTQPGVAAHRRPKSRRPGVRYPVEDVRLAEQLIERGLLLRRPDEAWIELMVTRDALYRQQGVVNK